MQELTFSTERLRISPWSDADAEWYVAAVDESDIRRWTREPQDRTVEAWRQDLRAIADSERREWSRIEAVDGALVGSISASADEDGVEFRYWIADGSRGRGYATEALRGAVGWWCDAGGAERFRLDIHPENVGSHRVAERAGFVFDRYEASCDTCADDQGRVAVYVRSG